VAHRPTAVTFVCAIATLARVVAWPTAAAAAPESDRTPLQGLTVAVTNPASLPLPNLSRAQSLTASIYGRAGVTLRWAVAGATEVPTLTVIIVNSTGRPVASTDVMGVARKGDDGSRGTIAYVFLDRVTAFADSNHVAPWAVLGAAMAHEIGHLLLPANAHDPYGIMRASWHPSIFPPIGSGVPGFSPEQARLVRAYVASRVVVASTP